MELESEIESTREQLQKTLRDEKQIMVQLDRVDRQLSHSRRDYRRLQRQTGEAQNAIGGAQHHVDRLNEEIPRLEGAFHERLVALYKSQQAGYPALVLTALDPNDAFRKYRNLMLILEEDAVYLQRVRDKIQEWEKARAQLVHRKDKLLGLQRAKQKQMERVRTQKSEKQRLLARIKSRKDLQEKALHHLEASSAQLQALIRSLEESTDRKPDSRISIKDPLFGRLKGRLPSPVTGTVKTRFGRQSHPLLKTYTLHNGIEIQAQEGAEIRAIHPGHVVFADWVQGYGNVIIVDHGAGYYSLCGHASLLLKEAGDDIQAGQTIGYVGETGSLIGPSLYFEIREEGKPVDPLEWIDLSRMNTGRR
jgi:septal ring factor EnvC (AmiA/AmiB activator)